MPYCANCGSQLTFNRKGQLECHCNAPISIMCGEGHRSTELNKYGPPLFTGDLVKRGYIIYENEYILNNDYNI